MRIVYITNGMASTLNSSLELSRRLTKAGHSVVYVSHEDIGSTVEAEGYEFVRLDEDELFREKAAELGTLRDVIRQPWSLLAYLKGRYKRRVQSAKNNEIERIIRRTDPDCALIDFEMHTAILAAISQRLPFVIPIVWFSIFKNANPPMNRAIQPSRETISERLRINLAWWKLHLGNFAVGLLTHLHRLKAGNPFPTIDYGTVSRADLKLFAKVRGLNLGEFSSRFEWSRPHVYQGFPILSFNTEKLELPGSSHPDLHYVGPMVCVDRKEGGADEESLEAWAGFRMERDEKRPLIYCSLGSFWAADTSFLRKVIEVFRRRGDWDLVIGLGNKANVADLGAIPQNVLALRWAPQIEVLKHADCAVTHGGITSINECLYFGVPMVVYSTGFVDQDGCAVRVERHRVGVVGDASKDGSDEIESLVERALGDDDIHENVLSIQDEIHRLAVDGEAIRIIEETASR